MNVALCDVDGHHFPNLALMKLSAWHKAQGDTVEWYEPLLSNPDRIYASKVFTFSPDAEFAPCHPEPIRGGTGYHLYNDLPPEIDSMLPDYSIYPQYQFAIGFLSRGCIRNCPWCVVPRKEGAIRQYDDKVAELGTHQLEMMDKEITEAERQDTDDRIQKRCVKALGWDCDKADWLKFREVVRAELAKRGGKA